MNILIVKTLIQSFVNRHDIEVYESDTAYDFFLAVRDEALDQCTDIDDDEILELLEYVRVNNLIEVLFKVS